MSAPSERYVSLAPRGSRAQLRQPSMLAPLVAAVAFLLIVRRYANSAACFAGHGSKQLACSTGRACISCRDGCLATASLSHWHVSRRSGFKCAAFGHRSQSRSAVAEPIEPLSGRSQSRSAVIYAAGLLASAGAGASHHGSLSNLQPRRLPVVHRMNSANYALLPFLRNQIPSTFINFSRKNRFRLWA